MLGLYGWLVVPPAAAQSSVDQELEAAYIAARAALIAGPVRVKLLDQATMGLEPEDGFIPRTEALRLLRALGKAASPDLLGLVVPRKAIGSWYIAVAFRGLGLAAPEKLSRLTKDDIYDQMRRSIHRVSDDNRQQGSPKLDLGDFVEPPAYDAKSDRMFVATQLIQAGDDDSASAMAKLDAYLFGRDGVLTLTLITHAGGYANLRHHMNQLHTGMSFIPGKRCADALPTDKRLEYPLEVLFGGRDPQEVAKERATAAAQARERAVVEEQREQADREWLLYMSAGAASVLLSSVAMFAVHRATSA